MTTDPARDDGAARLGDRRDAVQHVLPGAALGLDPEDVVARAREYAAFVMGEGEEADVVAPRELLRTVRAHA